MDWLAWLEAQIERAGTARALAASIGVDPSKITRWRNYPSFPTPEDQARLAEVSGTTLEEVRRLVWEAERSRLERRRHPRPGVFPGGAALSRPTPPVEPLPAVAARPITRGPGNDSTRHPRTGSRRKHTENKTYSVEFLFDDWGQRAA